MEKKYSVLMSVYYKESPLFLKQSINSMIEQTIKPDEIVLICDGKLTNELEKVINDFQKKYNELFNIIRFEKNYGLGHALARIPVEGDDRRDPGCARAFQRVYHDEQFHQIVICRRTSGLYDENIAAANVLVNFHKRLTVRKLSNIAPAKADTDIVADRFG